MAKSGDGVFDRLDDLEAPLEEMQSRGIKLSKITSKLKGSVDITPVLGKFQQLGLVKIIYNPSVDQEPLVQLTEQGMQQAREMLLSLKQRRQ